MSRFALDVEVGGAVSVLLLRLALHALCEMREEAELIVERHFAEVTLVGVSAAMATEVQHVDAVLREQDVAGVAAVEGAIVHQRIHDVTSVSVSGADAILPVGVVVLIALTDVGRRRKRRRW